MRRPHLADMLPAVQRAASKFSFITWIAYILLAIGLIAAALH
jgi:hypothetical protein